MVKWSADSKCWLKVTESRTIGDVMPGQNASPKIQWWDWSFWFAYNFWGYFKICDTDEDSLYIEKQNIAFTFDFTNSLPYVVLFSGFLVQEIISPSYNRYTWRFIQTEAIQLWFILQTNVYIATLILFTTMKKESLFQNISS